MQTNQNSKAIYIEEEINKVEYPLNEQLQRKAAILQRIKTFLNSPVNQTITKSNTPRS
jgi:hypothetical protein